MYIFNLENHFYEMLCIDLGIFNLYFIISTIFTFSILSSCFIGDFIKGEKTHNFSNYRQTGLYSDKPILLTLFVSLLLNYCTILKFKYALPFLLTTNKRMRYIKLF